jgi:cobalt-zinc-cadmium efflux system membrane fusion protein
LGLIGCTKKEEHPHKHGEGCHCYCFGQKEHPRRHNEGKHHEHEHEEEGVVQISSQAREMMGLKIDKVTLQRIEKSISVIGEIAQESEKLFHVTSKSPGEIVEVKSRLGDHVQKETLLALVKSSEDGKIKEIKSPAPSLLVGQHISKGEEVDTLASLFTIADLSTMKASFDVYEKDIPLVQVGQKVKVETSAYPGKIYPGKITYISPRVDETTRTLKIRVDIDNYDHTMKFGMFVKGYIMYGLPGKVRTVPNSAIQTRNDEKVVFVQLEEGKYIERKVKVGVEEEDFSQILSGLKIDEQIVTEGSFHLKAELQKRLIDYGAHGHPH